MLPCAYDLAVARGHWCCKAEQLPMRSRHDLSFQLSFHQIINFTGRYRYRGLESTRRRLKVAPLSTGQPGKKTIYLELSTKLSTKYLPDQYREALPEFVRVSVLSTEAPQQPP